MPADALMLKPSENISVSPDKLGTTGNRFFIVKKYKRYRKRRLPCGNRIKQPIITSYTSVALCTEAAIFFGKKNSLRYSLLFVCSHFPTFRTGQDATRRLKIRLNFSPAIRPFYGQNYFCGVLGRCLSTLSNGSQTNTHPYQS